MIGNFCWEPNLKLQRRCFISKIVLFLNSGFDSEAFQPKDFRFTDTGPRFELYPHQKCPKLCFHYRFPTTPRFSRFDSQEGCFAPLTPNLVRAVNRQPWLPRGMTRRAPPIAYTFTNTLNRQRLNEIRSHPCCCRTQNSNEKPNASYCCDRFSHS